MTLFGSIALLLPALGAVQTQATDQRLVHELALVAAVDEGRAAELVRRRVALGARMGGTRSGARANEARLAEFRALGLEAWSEDDGATWTHEAESWEVVLHLAGGARRVERAWPFGFSAPVAGRFALGTEAGVGAWIARQPPRRAAASGEPRIALVDGRNTPDGEFPVIGSLPPGPAGSLTVFGIPDADGAAARDALARGERVELEVRLETRIEEAHVHTVFARVPAREGAPPGYFLFCAHGDSDSGGPGANDNGSGEAIVFEIAAALAHARREGLLGPPREIRFALWGAEIHSSRAHLARVLEPDAVPLLGVLNFDQSGFGELGDRLYLEPDDAPHHAGLVAAILAVLGDHAGREGFPAKWATTGTQGGTDSYVFSDAIALRRAGVPALTMYASAWGRPRALKRTTGMPGMSDGDSDRVHVDHDPWYHSVGDVPERTTDRQPHFLGWHARVGLLGALRWLEGLDPDAAR